MSCGKCNVVISPAKSVVCITCETNYHPVCTKLKSLTNYKSVKDFWNCDVCLSKLKNVSTRNKKTEISLVDESDLNYDLDSVKTDFRNVLQKIEALSKNMVTIEESINFCSDSIDDFSSKLESAVKKISVMENKIEFYEQKCNKLEKEVNFLKGNICNAEQASMMNNIEISGVPKTANENVSEIIKIIAKVLNCEIKPSDILHSFRGKSYKNKDGNIFVQFSSKTVKDLLLNNIKLRHKNKNPLTGKHLHSSFKDSNIYINDQLTHYNKKLLWTAKEVAKNYNFKYTWANSGGIFIRKQINGQAFKISNLEILRKMDEEQKVKVLWENIE